MDSIRKLLKTGIKKDNTGFQFKNSDDILQQCEWLWYYMDVTAKDSMDLTARDLESLDWLSKLNSAVFDLENVCSDLKTKELRAKNASHFLLFPSAITCNYNIERRIKDIFLEIEDILEEEKKFPADENDGGSVFIRRQEKRCAVSFVTESGVYGRDEDKEKVINLLVNSNNLFVVSIVGMGGIGKTTLAKIVYNNEKVMGYFDLQLWVYVGEIFKVRDIGEQILEYLTGERCKISSTQIILQRVCSLFESKRVLLVLDDVWYENKTRLEMLLDSFCNCQPGSKIVITTRSMVAATIMGVGEIYKLEALSDDYCWMIFKHNAFGSGRNEVMKPSLVKIGKEIIGMCRGLPLAAKVLGSFMSTINEEDGWSYMKREIWDLPECEFGILENLKVSYDHMPTCMKKCFIYCSIFPKDYNIERLKLIHLWIAEGYIQPSQDRVDLEEIGNQYFNYMLQNFLFQNEQGDDYGNIVSCKMHDLIHDLAFYVDKEKSHIIKVGCDARIPYGCYNLSVVCDDDLSSEFLKEAIEARKLRSLIVYGKTQHLAQDIQEFIMHTTSLRAFQFSGFPIQAFPANIEKLKQLRFLDLSNTMIETVDNSISNLSCLQFLDLSNTKVEMLPESITMLNNLRTLRLINCANLQELPLAVGKLENLRLLDVSHSNLQALPKSITTLHHLRTLNLSKNSKIQELPLTIGDLHNLRLLDLSYSNVEALPDSITNLTNLQILNLRNCIELRELPEGIHNMINLTHLDNTECELICMPRGLGKLYKLQTLPLFVVGSKPGHTIEELRDLNHINGVLKITCISNVKDPMEAIMANLQAKEGLHSLELRWRIDSTRKWGEVTIDYASSPSLLQENVDVDIYKYLRPHTNLKHLTVEDYGGYPFPSWLTWMNNLESFSLYNIERCESLAPLGHLPLLNYLKIESVYALKKIDNLGGNFLSLQYFKLWNLPALDEWFLPEENMFPSLLTLIIVGCPKLRIHPCLPSSLLELEIESVNKEIIFGESLCALSRLRKLKIANFEASESWWIGIKYLAALENLEIQNCYLTYLPDCILQQHFPSFSTLTLSMNDDLKSLGEREGLVPPFFSELQNLILKGCGELTALPEWLCELNLRYLEISYCDNLKVLPDNLHRGLTELVIRGCPKLEECEYEINHDTFSKGTFFGRACIHFLSHNLI